jgi:hypothetical protein
LQSIGEQIGGIRGGLEKARENEERGVEAGKAKAEERCFEVSQVHVL